MTCSSRPSSIGDGTPARRRLELLFASPAESQGPETRRVGDAEEVVRLRECSHRPASPFGAAALGPLHEPTPPGVWRGVAHRAEDRLALRGREDAAAEPETGVDRKTVVVGKPGVGVLERDGFAAARGMTPKHADRVRHPP